MRHNHTFSTPNAARYLTNPVKPPIPYVVVASPRRTEDSRATIGSPSREKLSSLHRIDRKKSPTKINLVSTQNVVTPRQTLHSSKVTENGAQSTVRKKVVVQSPLADRSNVAHPEIIHKEQLRCLNQVYTSPNPRKSPSVHVREHLVRSPQKIMVVSQPKQPQVDLSIKVKVLEKRVEELHREKQAVVARMNEQNRRVYHENTTLRLQVTKLQKKIEEQLIIEENKAKQTPPSPVKAVQALGSHSLETSLQRQLGDHLLKEEICELENLLQAQIDKNLTLMEKYNELEKIRQELVEKPTQSSQQRESQRQALIEMTNQRDKYKQSLLEVSSELEALTAKAARMQEEHSGLEELLKTKSNEIQTMTVRVATLEEEHEQYHSILTEKQEQLKTIITKALKLEEDYDEVIKTRESELKAIENLMQDTNKKNAQVIQEYEVKIEEYANAYNNNQKVIEQLSDKLLGAPKEKQPEDKQTQSLTQQYQEGKLHVLHQCYSVEESEFKVTLEEKDNQINEYQDRIQQLKNLLSEEEQLCCEVSLRNQEQAERLQQVSESLRGLNKRYEELQIKYEEALQSKEEAPKTNRSVEKCPKCEELMKTIIRLNMHLNAQKTP